MDKDLISSYIECYATSDFDVDAILAPWESAKSQYLTKLLNGKLILEKPIEFKRDREEMLHHFNRVHWDHGYMHSMFYEFRSAISKFFPIKDYQERYNIYRIFTELFSFDNFYENKLIEMPRAALQSDNTYEIETPSGKIKLIPGAKLMRTVRGICKAYKLEEIFEDYRILSSKILADRTTKGMLCLSIHPLDYMTMSDNNHDWSSCMSWYKGGCLRTGTLEMMNSTSVIVAYLKSNNTNFEFTKGCQWNSKKWRQLIIVDKEVILNNRPYPSKSDYLTNEVLKWVKELAEENLGWEYDSTYHKFPGCLYIEDRDIFITPRTNIMYNDFDDHQGIFNCYIGKNVEDNNNVTLDFSGTAYCLTCGKELEYNHDDDENENLVCDRCHDVIMCSHCGSKRHSSDMIAFKGEFICNDCEDTIKTCCVCGEKDYIQFMMKVHYDNGKDSTLKLFFCQEHFQEIRNEIEYFPINGRFKSGVLSAEQKEKYGICKD